MCRCARCVVHGGQRTTLWSSIHFCMHSGDQWGSVPGMARRSHLAGLSFETPFTDSGAHPFGEASWPARPRVPRPRTVDVPPCVDTLPSDCLPALGLFSVLTWYDCSVFFCGWHVCFVIHPWCWLFWQFVPYLVVICVCLLMEHLGRF